MLSTSTLVMNKVQLNKCLWNPYYVTVFQVPIKRCIIHLKILKFKKEHEKYNKKVCILPFTITTITTCLTVLVHYGFTSTPWILQSSDKLSINAGSHS